MSRTAADSWVANNKATIESAQTTIFNSIGRYHQCLDSHSVIPDTPAIPDKQGAKTTDTDEGWSNLTGAILSPSEAIGACVSIVVYRHQGVRGWVLGVKAKEGTTEYIETFGYGPQASQRTRPWTLLPQAPTVLKQAESDSRKAKR
jgi:hypothetical protein